MEPIIALADGALDSGSVDELVSKITAHISRGIHERFASALQKKRRANANVAAGRAYVAAYIECVHYIEGIHGAAMGSEAQEGAVETQPAIGSSHHH